MSWKQLTKTSLWAAHFLRSMIFWAGLTGWSYMDATKITCRKRATAWSPKRGPQFHAVVPLKSPGGLQADQFKGRARLVLMPVDRCFRNMQKRTALQQGLEVRSYPQPPLARKSRACCKGTWQGCPTENCVGSLWLVG